VADRSGFYLVSTPARTLEDRQKRCYGGNQRPEVARGRVDGAIVQMSGGETGKGKNGRVLLAAADRQEVHDEDRRSSGRGPGGRGPSPFQHKS